MQDTYPQDFFIYNRWILKIAGLWKPKSDHPYIQKSYKTYAVFVFLFVNVWFTLTEFISLFYTINNEDAFIKNLNFFLTHFMGAVKVIFWHFNGKYVIKIMKVLEDKRFYYNSTHFKPGTIFLEHKKTGRFYSLLSLGFPHIILILSYIPPIVIVLKHMKNNKVKLPEILPYYSWMPFGYETGPKYLLALVYQAGPMFSYAYSIVGVDTLYMNLINCIGANLSIIQNAFITIHQRCLDTSYHPIHCSCCELYDSKRVKEAMSLEFRKITNHLQTIYRVSKYLEYLYRHVALFQVGATLFILCTCLYLVSTSPPGSKQFLGEVVYMFAMFFQLYVYCSFGHEVAMKSNDLPYCIWSCNWLSSSTSFKKDMIFTMARTKIPVYFTAGKFMPLTLLTFMSIIKTSYSIFALIKNKRV